MYGGEGGRKVINGSVRFPNGRNQSHGICEIETEATRPYFIVFFFFKVSFNEVGNPIITITRL